MDKDLKYIAIWLLLTLIVYMTGCASAEKDRLFCSEAYRVVANGGDKMLLCVKPDGTILHIYKSNFQRLN